MIATIALFIVILGILVFVHEMGHFLMARKTGMGIEEFGFGFPPRIFGIQRINNKDEKAPGIKKFNEKWRLIKGGGIPKEIPESKGNTIYSLNWIPIGGFVKIKGEQGDKSEEKDSFSSKKIWQRALVLFAGVAMNFITAFVIIAIGFCIGLPSIIDSELSSKANIKDQRIQIVEVEKETPAEKADLKMGDIIISTDNQKILTTDDFKNYSKSHLNKEITINVLRGNEELQKKIIPKDLYDKNEGVVGVWLAETGIVSYPLYYSIWMGAKTTVSITWQILVAIYDILRNLVTSQPVGADIAGPVGIAVLTGQVAKMGFIYILQFVALLSINLAIINLVPFPALDGSRILFLAIEKIRGKPLNQKVEAAIHNVGFMVLIGLILLVTFQDVSRFSDSIKGFLSNVF
jgi:regulator of sigma E protease